MAIVQHENSAHTATCNHSEMIRQGEVSAAIAASNPAAVKVAEIAHYRRVIASCAQHGIPHGDFLQALRDLGAR